MNTITFILPTLGRDSLKKSIESIINQTNKKWKAIVIFDGCQINKNLIVEHNQISYYEIEKSDGVINQASSVRNYGLKFVKTQWVGFLDDDDTIASDYVDFFYKEMNLFHCDVYVYRMINKDLTIFPSLKSKNIIPCDIGISFICTLKLFESISFQNSHCEDYDFLKKVFDAKKLIIFSNTIKYFVKSNEKEYIDEQLEYPNQYKIFLNGIHPFLYLFYLNFFSKK